jgi:hypothetical protein
MLDMMLFPEERQRKYHILSYWERNRVKPCAFDNSTSGVGLRTSTASSRDFSVRNAIGTPAGFVRRLFPSTSFCLPVL